MSSQWCCAGALRDVKAWRDAGFHLNISSNEAAKMLDAVIRQAVSYSDCEQLGGISGTIDRLCHLEPDSIMVRLVILGLLTQSLSKSSRTDPELAGSIKKLVMDANSTSTASKWEKDHVKAMELYATGQMRSAAMQWERILAEHPTDLFALKCAQNAYIFVNDPLALRDAATIVKDNEFETNIDHWQKGFACGMYAFGLEECGEYKEARQYGLKALELNPLDAWATHSVAHCYEMASDFHGGIDFLEGKEREWTRANLVEGHNWWHKALYYMEAAEYESALDIFDKKIIVGHHGPIFSAFDGASLLTRLELVDGVSVGANRWEQLLPLVEPRLDDHCTAYNDTHYAMVLAQLGKYHGGVGKVVGEGHRHRESIVNFIRDEEHLGCCCKDNVCLLRDLGLDLCDAVHCYANERYSEVFDLLYPLRRQIHRIGGSRAQADVFTQLLISAGIRCGAEDPLKMKQTLLVLEERARTFPNSTLGARLSKKWMIQKNHAGIASFLSSNGEVSLIESLE